LSVVLAAAMVSCRAPETSGERSAAGPAARTEVLAWVTPYDDSLASLARSARFLTIASPTFFRLAVDGKSVRLEDWDPNVPFPRQRLASSLGAASVEVLPLVGCIGACGPMISRVLDDDGARKAHVDALVKTAHEQNLAGLVIDYEDVNARQASVDRFVSDLASALHAAHKRLVLVVQEPCGAAPACHRDPYPFSLGTLADVVDLLVVMEYDYVVDGSGPPAPRAWVERGLSKVSHDVPPVARRKIIAALPLYGRVTRGMAPDTAVLWGDVHGGAFQKRNVTVGALSLDPEVLSKVARVSTATATGTLYLEDRETLALRLDRLAPLGLGGVALWRLGGEDPCITVALAKLRGLPAPTCE
jgi:spore germination protein YaaH